MRGFTNLLLAAVVLLGTTHRAQAQEQRFANLGDFRLESAAAVQARVLVIVNKQDHTLTPEPAIEFARLLHADLVELDDDCGHQYNACDDEPVRTAVAEFLLR